MGWTVGVGVEHKLGAGLVLGLEYDYYDLGKHSFAGSVNGLTQYYSSSVGMTSQAALARLSYKFGP